VELAVDEVQLVILLGDEGRDGVLSDGDGEAHVEPPEDVGVGVDHLRLLAEVVTGLSSHGNERQLLAFLPLGLHELLGDLDEVRVEAPAEPPVGGHEDDPDSPGVPNRQKRVGPRVHTQGQAVQHVHELDRVGAKVLHPLLGGLELRRRDHVHGAGDLLGLLNGVDLSLDVSQCGHSLSLFPYIAVIRMEPRHRRLRCPAWASSQRTRSARHEDSLKLGESVLHLLLQLGADDLLVLDLAHDLGVLALHVVEDLGLVGLDSLDGQLV